MFISSIPKWLYNSNETLNSSSRSKESHTSFKKISKHSKVVKMNFKSKGSVAEWKLVARKSFENFSYVGVPPIPQLLLHELIQLVPLFGTMKFVHAYQKSWKSRKLLKRNRENEEGACQKEIWQQKFIESKDFIV